MPLGALRFMPIEEKKRIKMGVVVVPGTLHSGKFGTDCGACDEHPVKALEMTPRKVRTVFPKQHRLCTGAVARIHLSCHPQGYCRYTTNSARLTPCHRCHY